MKKTVDIKRLSFLMLLVFGAVLSRWLPHPPNFTPIGALALFGAAYFRPKWTGILLVLGSMLISDLWLGFHKTIFFVYGAFIIIHLLASQMLQKTNGIRLFFASLTASLVFFLITNFGVWLLSTMYSHDFVGLVMCYVAAIPFFGNTLMGDLFYTGVLFGAWQLVIYLKPSLA